MTSIQCIEDEAIDPEHFVSAPWSDDVLETEVPVQVNKRILYLFPALKIEQGLRLTQLLKAIGDIEEEFLHGCSTLKRNPEREHLRVLKAWPHRVTANDVWKPLSETNYKPEHRCVGLHFDDANALN